MKSPLDELPARDGTMADERIRYRGGDVAEGYVEKGLADPLDELLLDWRSLDALGKETARLQALWRRGLLTNRALRAGVWALDRMAAMRGRDRKSVVEGKRVDLGGGRIIKKKKKGRDDGRETEGREV